MNEGFSITNLTVSHQSELKSPDPLMYDGRLRIALDTPLLPDGATIDIMMDFTVPIPEEGHSPGSLRLDVQDGTIYQVAHWYPRMSVYDDVHGWQTPTVRHKEAFFPGFGNYVVEISAPSDFVVVASGTLVNEEEVFTPLQIRRFETAQNDSTIVPIITPEEVGKRKSRPGGSELLTWIYRAENVRDMPWVASQAFVLDAAIWEGTKVLSAYPREGLGTMDHPGWENAISYVLEALRYKSAGWPQYPYPYIICVAGARSHDAPMMIWGDVHTRGKTLFYDIHHEFAHSWFASLLGSDRQRYAWLDEGLATFMAYYSSLGPRKDAASPLNPKQVMDHMIRFQNDLPIMTHSGLVYNDARQFIIYEKPAFGLRLLREYVFTPEQFDAALIAYINRWKGKHPTPADFFRTIEQVTGADLSWFWRGWFYGSDLLDQSIEIKLDDQQTPQLVIRHRTNLLFPVDVEYQYLDGTSERATLPVESFYTQDYVTLITSREQPFKRIFIDPDKQLPDIDRSNNIWPR